MRTRSIAAVVFTLVTASMCITPTAAATFFGAPKFAQVWQATEPAVPNFWGPLATAHDPQLEPYVEGQAGQVCPPGKVCTAVISTGKRLVQYFDKVRMELNRPDIPVTTGLLTVEMKTGRMQTGDTTFEQRQPAKINIAGDPGTDGLTYGDLVKLPERVAENPNIETVPPSGFDPQTGEFFAVQNISVPNIPIGPAPFYGPFLRDPGGRYGQYVFKPFSDFIAALPTPLDQTTGYPISPVIQVQVSIGGVPTSVLVQAFERRVLTYNGRNPPGARVEFGNIGGHYYRWRYGDNA